MKYQSTTDDRKLVTATLKLFDYCRKSDWAGYDPYDALNSEIFKRLPLLDSKLPRLVLTQVLKRSPINFRSLLLVPKTQNPKALGLFLTAFLNLSKQGLLDQDNLVRIMVEKLITLRSPDTSYWCWGYSFPWQGRSILAPRGAPNIVCTVFVANALIDTYEKKRDANYLAMAASTAEYILNELYWENDNSDVGFSYPLPSLQTRVHNANFLGAALFCRIYKHSGEKRFLEPALKVARYSVTKQNEDGSWYYGEDAKQRWIDNFHTGYNLCALRCIGQYADTDEFEPVVRSGFAFYREHFFRENGAPKYFHDRTYPIDIHSAAQSIITLVTLKDLHEDNLALARSSSNGR